MFPKTVAQSCEPIRSQSGPRSLPAMPHPPHEFQIVRATHIGPELAAAWNRLRASNPALASPYFDIEFTKAVARVRDDVEIAFEKRDGQIVEIFPFQKTGVRQIAPVGGLINDVHGVISRSGENSNLINQLLQARPITSFPFHAAQNGEGLERYQFETKRSYFLDLSQGWEAYRRWVRQHSSTVARQGQKTRRLEREVGPLRFEFDLQNDAAMLEELIGLKRAKYQRSKTFDILSVEWAGQLLREIYTTRQPSFRGLLSGLWAGDQLVALHFGMLTDDVLHYWFPVYCPKFSRYSPGTELLMRVAETASQQGVKKVDLGYGDDPYKLKFSNGLESVCCGHIASNRFAFEVAKRRYEWRNQLKKIPMKPLAKVLLRSVFPGFGNWNYR